MDVAIQGAKPLTTVVVCHNNKVLLNLGKIQAERHGMRVFVARNGNDVLVKARRHRPELIVLGHDLRDPSTQETVQMLESDPLLRGTRVVTVKGMIPNLRDMIGRFPGP